MQCYTVVLMPYNTLIGATLHNKLKTMQLHELKLDSTRLSVHDVHGKSYPIKKQRGRYYIQHARGQLTVTPLMKEVIPYDGSITDYVFNGWFLEYDYDEFKTIIMKHILTLTFFLLSLYGKSQFVAFGGGGVVFTQGIPFSGELGLGYRLNKVSLTAGYVSPPRADLPVFFNARLGYQYGKVLIYGGYARETGFKVKHHPDMGFKVSLSNYQNGDMWIGGGYCGVPYAHVGFSWNLFGNE